jgi:PAS domain S-box-containing protein
MSTNERQIPASLELRSFIDHLPSLAWSALPDGSLEFFNQRLQDYTGFTPNQLYRAQWKSFAHSDDTRELETWWQVLSHSQVESTKAARLRRFDGEYRWFQISATPVHDDQGKLVRWCGINTDINDLKRSEQKFREDEADLRAITDAIHQSIVVLAPDGKTLFANRVALDRTAVWSRWNESYRPRLEQRSMRHGNSLSSRYSGRSNRRADSDSFSYADWRKYEVSGR